MEQKLSATVLKLEGELVRIYIHERDLLCLLPLQSIYLNDGSLADSLLRIRDKLDIIYSDGQVKGILSEIEATLGIIIKVTDTLATITDQEGRNQYEVPIREIYNTSDRVIMKGAQVRIQEVKRDLRRCSYIHDSIPIINPSQKVELPILSPYLYEGSAQIQPPHINSGTIDLATNSKTLAQSHGSSHIKYSKSPHTIQERAQITKPNEFQASLNISKADRLYKLNKIVQPIEHTNNSIMFQTLSNQTLPLATYGEEKVIPNSAIHVPKSDLNSITEERKASPASIPKGYVKQEISDIPQSTSQSKDICLFCNEVKNKDEFYADKICKCKMCLNCYCEQQSLTTCKKCFEPLSMEKLTTCKRCFTKKFDRFMITLECYHSYCKECLESYIQNQMRHSNGCVSCPDPYCHQMISIEMRKNLTQLRNTQDDKSIRINEVSSSQPHNRNVCSICKYSDAAKFITQLDCNHSFCTDCLENYLKYKIRNDLVKRKGIECCICDIRISDKILEKVLDRRTYNQYINQMEIISKMTVKCPNKHNTQAYNKSAQCNVCNMNFCVVCKKEPHLGVCERRGFWGFKLKDSCPECNKRSKKASNSFQNYVICKNPDCNTSFCKYCYQRYSPILAHGRSYHKSGCPLYQYYPHQSNYNPLECEECKKLGVICPIP